MTGNEWPKTTKIKAKPNTVYTQDNFGLKRKQSLYP